MQIKGTELTTTSHQQSSSAPPPDNQISVVSSSTSPTQAAQTAQESSASPSMTHDDPMEGGTHDAPKATTVLSEGPAKAIESYAVENPFVKRTESYPRLRFSSDSSDDEIMSSGSKSSDGSKQVSSA
ncbi:hypothetical protein L596_019673 [Steinernema carpocapsae]|uniref:Uncharacterized protein n=1 Tax=Steinernema carpocapsae TaxID=34508 RepID=A0A4U5MR80_STECR|nr:hypothetical protein L596_019673 [Steinernema carpocapsae]